jgi:hypothetical protein
MRNTLVCLIVLFLIGAPADGQGPAAEPVELTLYPAKAPEPSESYRLLPSADEQADADAVPLYQKALRPFPSDLQMDQINGWLKIPIEQLPREQVQATLDELKPILELLEQAARCRQCDWPYVDDDTLSLSLPQYRTLVLFLDLQVRLQVARGQRSEAIRTIQTGLAMAEYLGKGPTLLQAMLGIAVGARICRQLEQFIQSPNAPNLYEALRNLPRPFIDLTSQAKWEEPEIREKAFLLVKRLDRHVAALQCIEALRLYAGTHEGKFPDKLSDVTEMPVPDDPVTEKPFAYRRTGTQAALEAPAPQGAEAKAAMRYLLTLKGWESNKSESQ